MYINIKDFLEGVLREIQKSPLTSREVEKTVSNLVKALEIYYKEKLHESA